MDVGIIESHDCVKIVEWELIGRLPIKCITSATYVFIDVFFMNFAMGEKKFFFFRIQSQGLYPLGQARPIYPTRAKSTNTSAWEIKMSTCELRENRNIPSIENAHFLTSY